MINDTFIPLGESPENKDKLELSVAFLLSTTIGSLMLKLELILMVVKNLKGKLKNN